MHSLQNNTRSLEIVFFPSIVGKYELRVDAYENMLIREEAPVEYTSKLLQSLFSVSYLSNRVVIPFHQ